MARKKSKKKWYALTISIVAAVSLFIVFGLPALGYPIQFPSFSGFQGFFQGGEQAQIDPEPTGPESTNYWLTLSVSPENMCVGQSSTGYIKSNMPNALCVIMSNTGSGFQFYQNAVLDSTGRYTRSQTVNTVGSVQLRATCAVSDGNYRISNTVLLTVTDCDSDGDGHSNSEEIEAGTDPFDGSDYPGSEDQYYCCLAMGVNSCYEGGCPPTGIQLGLPHATLSECQSRCNSGWWWCCMSGSQADCFQGDCPIGWDWLGQSASQGLCEETCSLPGDGGSGASDCESWANEYGIEYWVYDPYGTLEEMGCQAYADSYCEQFGWTRSYFCWPSTYCCGWNCDGD